jgi:putative redox protein
MAVGGCTGINVAKILEKMREPFTALAVEVDADRATTDPKKFTVIRLTFKFAGEVKPANAERAVRLTLDTYCSVANSLSASFAFACEVNGARYPEKGFIE